MSNRPQQLPVIAAEYENSLASMLDFYATSAPKPTRSSAASGANLDSSWQKPTDHLGREENYKGAPLN